MTFVRTSMAVAMLALSALSAQAEADGPDAWRVIGVRPDDTLHLHAEASARSRTILQIPHDAKGLLNRGCKAGPTFAQWQSMSVAQRERAARARWCRVAYKGKTGWVAGRFLAEGATPPPEAAGVTIGAWRVSCAGGPCAIEQQGVGGQRPTRFIIEPDVQGNARLTVERTGMARTGTVAIYMDGDEISRGPLAPLRKGSDRLVMEPDDITLGIVRRMARQKNMVISLPGEERGVEFHLDDFTKALGELNRMRASPR